MARFAMSILAVLLTFPAAHAGEAPDAPPAPDDPRLEFLRGLEGTWSAPPMAEGQPPGVFEFRVTAGGHAVEEREWVGTPMEMVTLYHMSGGDLVATHYCMLGNQPRLKASKRVVDGSLSFACAGTPGNAASHDEKHVHGWSMKLGDDGRLLYSAELMEKGELAEHPDMVLTRTRDTAGR